MLLHRLESILMRFGWAVLAALAIMVLSVDQANAYLGVARLESGSRAAWTDDQGRPVVLSDLKGEAVIMTMAYTACRKTCSATILTLQEMQRVADRLGRKVRFVVVSYDPENDSPAAWQAYRRQRGLTRDNWLFLTGTAAETKRFARFLDLDYWSYDEHVMHDFRIALFDSEGRLRRKLTWEQRDAIEDFMAAQ